jgi:hypothetical protein
MKPSIVAILVLAALFLASCMDLETSTRLERIAAMERTIDSVEVVFKEHKLDSMAVLSIKAYDVENRIKKNYNADTIDMELGRKMDAFKVMRRSFNPMGKAMSAIPVSIEEEREKLAQLKTDIENGDGKREKYDEYLNFEEAKVAQLRTILDEFVETKTTALKTYDELYVELNDFSKSLLKKN